jgi:putative molybdopterin biosynthesis protein
MREHVRLEDGIATIEAQTTPGRHVRPVGEDLATGELLFAPGRRLGPVDVAAAAAAGVTELTVHRRPLVAILPTGDELRPADAHLAPGELADTNSLMLEAQAREAGCDTHRGPILPDDPELLAVSLRAAAREADLIVLVAGTSAGRQDHAPAVLRRCGRIVVRGVAMRPGHPVVLGIVDRTPVIACPGYPVSAALAFDELALPLLASLSGAPAAHRPAVAARLATDVASKPGSDERLRVRLGTVAGLRVAVPLRRGASVLTSLAQADGLLTIPAERDGFAAGAAVEAEVLRSCAPVDGVVLLAGAPDRALDLLALAVADAGARVAFCEMAPDAALALVNAGLCHAAAVAGTPSTSPVDAGGGGHLAIRLAESEIAFAFDGYLPHSATPYELLDSHARVVVGPPGTPARRLLDELLRDTPGHACAITEVRSDAAAVAAVAAGHADCAVSALPAARHAGLDTLPLGRAGLDLVVHRSAADDDAAVAALLEALASRGLAGALEADGYDVERSQIKTDLEART